MYSLTDKDRKIIQGTINKVNNLTGNMSPNPKRRSKPAFRYAEITGVLEDGFYSAKEIRFLADGTHEDAPNGIIWDGEKVKLLITGSVSAGTVTRVEPFYMVEEDKIVNIWAGSAVGGGGDVKARIEILSDTSISQGGVIQVNIVDLEGAVIIPNTQAVQYKFELAKFYAGEIVYGDLTTNKNGGSYYLLDPYLAGVGGNSAE